MKTSTMANFMCDVTHILKGHFPMDYRLAIITCTWVKYRIIRNYWTMQLVILCFVNFPLCQVKVCIYTLPLCLSTFTSSTKRATMKTNFIDKFYRPWNLRLITRPRHLKVRWSKLYCLPPANCYVKAVISIN